MKPIMRATALALAMACSTPAIAEPRAESKDFDHRVGADSPAIREWSIAKAWLNFRAGASRQARVLDVLPRGTRVLLLGLHGDYAQVARVSDGATGYVAARYLLQGLDDTRVPVPQPATAALGESDRAGSSVPSARDEQADQLLSSDVAKAVESASLDNGNDGSAGDLSVAQREPESGYETIIGNRVIMPRSAAKRWYLTADVGYVSSGIDAEELQRSLQNAATSAEVRRLDESSMSWLLGVGYRWMPHWAIELGVMDMGAYDSEIDVRNADEAAVRRILAAEHPVGGAGLRLAIVGQLKLRGMSLSATVGAFRSGDTDVDVLLDGQKATVKGEDFSVLLEGAAGYSLNPDWEAQLFISHLDLNQQLLNSGLRLRFSF